MKMYDDALQSKKIRNLILEISRCPYLGAGRTCNVFVVINKPGVFQFSEYCKTKNHRKCPFYLKSITSEKIVLNCS
ncbi:MAG: hypothetical protein C4526_04215 [Nitrospiraceae bacterium]|nr:MAG: hypothetical protein C4526_04215 [Nitrospiraceae bacterium]